MSVCEREGERDTERGVGKEFALKHILCSYHILEPDFYPCESDTKTKTKWFKTQKVC